jgi:methionine aminopeptidase
MNQLQKQQIKKQNQNKMKEALINLGSGKVSSLNPFHNDSRKMAVNMNPKEVAIFKKKKKIQIEKKKKEEILEIHNVKGWNPKGAFQLTETKMSGTYKKKR